MKDEKILYIDYDNLDTIKKAEDFKEWLENEGYILTKTKQWGINSFMSFYKKEVKN